ncbi:hypothetical protein [Bdellovibrio sp. KM01]|uniref:hypothetical protein n=1 Tax=Bdellovibrio sp. KM01 TaxID=2748865 RepID=UPI0015E95869|nr:hypothetical protein [Bdellovibrio sp. KM01]QLY24501.1 hypothetical protein HW988_13685 [Bdellovibrio sp. KM01]
MNTTQSLMTLVTLVSALSFLTACQPSSHKKVDPTLIYEFEFNGCNTGAHGFKTLAEYCEALSDNILNRGCAVGLREQEYANRCEGQEQKTTPSTPKNKKDDISATVLNWSSSESAYTNSSVISGSMMVDSFSDTSAVEYNFAIAKGLSETTEDNHCTIRAHFEPAILNKMLSFTILVQQSHSQTYSCANKVEESLRQGTFLDLSEVTVKYKNGKYALKNVVLKLIPKN